MRNHGGHWFPWPRLLPLPFVVLLLLVRSLPVGGEWGNRSGLLLRLLRVPNWIERVQVMTRKV